MSCEPERESDGVGMRAVGVWDFETARPGKEGGCEENTASPKER